MARKHILDALRRDVADIVSESQKRERGRALHDHDADRALKGAQCTTFNVQVGMYTIEFKVLLTELDMHVLYAAHL